MTRNRRVLLAAAVAGVTALSSFSANAFFGPMNWMNGGGWGPGWGGWGPGWGGWGPGWGYPYYGGWGYPYYGGWGYPYYGGWGYPYAGLPVVAAPVVTQPTTSAEK